MKDDMFHRQKHYPPDLEFDDGLDDEQLFEEAMSEVRPLDSRVELWSGKEGLEPRRAGAAQDKEIVSPRDILRQFLEKEGVEGCHRAGYVEGSSHQSSEFLLRRLRAGEFSVRAELDLHGLSQRKAPDEIERFLRTCSRRNVTCVRIIHGKGKNSQNHVPVLKRQVPRWLSRRRISRYVVAYASARPVDGGLGAIYVLLRKA